MINAAQGTTGYQGVLNFSSETLCPSLMKLRRKLIYERAMAIHTITTARLEIDTMTK